MYKRFLASFLPPLDAACSLRSGRGPVSLGAGVSAAAPPLEILDKLATAGLGDLKPMSRSSGRCSNRRGRSEGKLTEAELVEARRSRRHRASRSKPSRYWLALRLVVDARRETTAPRRARLP